MLLSLTPRSSPLHQHPPHPLLTPVSRFLSPAPSSHFPPKPLFVSVVSPVGLSSTDHRPGWSSLFSLNSPPSPGCKVPLLPASLPANQSIRARLLIRNAQFPLLSRLSLASPSFSFLASRVRPLLPTQVKPQLATCLTHSSSFSPRVELQSTARNERSKRTCFALVSFHANQPTFSNLNHAIDLKTLFPGHQFDSSQLLLAARSSTTIPSPGLTLTGSLLLDSRLYLSHLYCIAASAS
jgi:hypothetical protein